MSSRRSSSLPSSLQQWADPGEVRREANPSSIPQRQSTVAPFMQPALSASSAVWAAAREVFPRACRPRSTCSSGRACHLPLSGGASLPAAPERPLPATPAIGPLSSLSTVHTLQRLRLCLTPAHTVPVCLWCPTSRASARLSHTVPSAQCMDAVAVQLSFPHQLSQLTGSHLLEDVKPLNLSYSVSSRLQQLARPAEGRQLNRPTT